MEQLCKHCKKPITEDDRRWVCRNEHCPTQYCEDCCDKREFWDNKDYCEHCDDGKKADYDKVLHEDEMAKEEIEELKKEEKMEQLKFNYDDTGMRCWEHPDEGWATEADRDDISEEFRKMIEAHPEFDEWKERCGECGADDEHCECEEEEQLCEGCRDWNELSPAEYHSKWSGKPVDCDCGKK